ncbi:MAG: response regulator [Blastocatellia bacterium]
MKHTILAVDDEPANLRMLERLFHKEFHVLTAASGEEGLEVLRNHSVSLIVTDQRMPGMSGTEMLRESMRTNPDAVKIILTGYTDTDALIDAINSARVYKFVSKPWDPVALKETVRAAINERETRFEQKRLIDGLISLIQSHPGLFIGETANDAEMVGEEVD